MKYVDIFYVMKEINKQSKKARCHFEDRKKKYKFGIKNYGEIPKMLNIADGDPWDVFAPGYDYMPMYKLYKIKKIIGIYLLQNGNYKIAVKLYKPGYDDNVAKRDIETYCKRYTEYTKIKGDFIYV